MVRFFRSLLAVLALSSLLFSAGCKKDKDDKDDSSDGKYPFSNTEYTGTAKVGNHYFPRPLSLRFDDNLNVSAFSHFFLGKVYKDVPGKVTKWETDGSGQTVLTVVYDLPGEDYFNSPQVYTISADKETITGGTAPLTVMVNMKRFPKNAPSVVGFWAQPTQPGWFPDVNAIFFLTQGYANYWEGVVKPVYSTIDKSVVFQAKYETDGSRITFYGVNTVTEPGKIHLIPYYGVLSAEGNTLYLDAYESTARLTSSFSTFEYNGPRGVTPWLLKQK